MLFVKYYSKGEVEVIGKAEGLKDVYNAEHKPANAYEHNPELLQSQIDYINKQPYGVTYGGASILDIFSGSGQQNVFITYEAEKVYVPKAGKRLLIRFHSERLPDEWEKCLVTFRGGYVGIMCYASDLYGVDEYDFCDEKGMAGWFDYDRELGHYSRDDVIAWLPLPTPYKAESEDKE
jgi:hypothetical protein